MLTHSLHVTNSQTQDSASQTMSLSLWWQLSKLYFWILILICHPITILVTTWCYFLKWFIHNYFIFQSRAWCHQEHLIHHHPLQSMIVNLPKLHFMQSNISDIIWTFDHLWKFSIYTCSKMMKNVGDKDNIRKAIIKYKHRFQQVILYHIDLVDLSYIMDVILQNKIRFV